MPFCLPCSSKGKPRETRPASEADIGAGTSRPWRSQLSPHGRCPYSRPDRPLCSNKKAQGHGEGSVQPLQICCQADGRNVPGTPVWAHGVPGGQRGGGSAGLALLGTPRSEPRGRGKTTRPALQNQYTNNPQTSALPAADGGCSRLSPAAGAALRDRGFSAALSCPRGSPATQAVTGDGRARPPPLPLDAAAATCP